MEASSFYRITGPQSVERLTPLLKQVCIETFRESSSWAEANESSRELDFVWETACEKSWRERHQNARVLNRLNNSQVGLLFYPA